MTNSAHSERSMSIALAGFGRPHSVFPWEEPEELKKRTIDRVHRFLKADVPNSALRRYAPAAQQVRPCEWVGAMAATAFRSRSEMGQGQRSRAAVRGSALPQRADQPLLQLIICSVPSADVRGIGELSSPRASYELSWTMLPAARITRWPPLWREEGRLRRPTVLSKQSADPISSHA